MKSRRPGKRTSLPAAEVQAVTPHGVWLLVSGREYLLRFEDHPWFKAATIGQILHLEFTHGKHLRWPELDVDLHVESIEHPEHYPLSFS